MKFLPLLPALVALLLVPRIEAARLLSVSELNYNPLDGSDYEYLELVNLGATAFDLGGAAFTNGISYTFKSGTVLAPGGRIVVAGRSSAFTTLYGTVGINLASGSYTGKLSNSGDTITLVDRLGKGLLSFAYDSSGAWPSRANGLGSSLECIDPAGDLNDPLNWRSSTEYNGSPGSAGVGPLNTIVINEVLTHTDPPIEDAIELYNMSGTSVDLSNWYVSNQRADPKKFHVPPGTVMPPHSFRVFYELRGTGNPAGFNAMGTGSKPEFTFNSAHGDEAVVLSTTGGTKPQYWVDAVTYDTAEHGYSFGRHPDFTGPLVIMDHLTLGSRVDDTFPMTPAFLTEFRTGTGASNAQPRVGPVVINRIMYHPLPNGDEFVELLNLASTNLPLFDIFHPTNTWRLSKGGDYTPDNPTNSWAGTKDVDYPFPPGIVLAPGGKLMVVPLAPAAFRTKYAVPTEVQILGPWNNTLKDTGDSVQLFKPDPPQEPPHPDAGFVPYIRVEKINYEPVPPWPAADGTGAALQRRTPAQYGNDPANWTVDTAPPPPAVALTLLNATTVQLSFTAAPGRGYVIETTADVSVATVWKTLLVLDPTVNGSAVRLPVTITGARQFLRVR